MKNKFNPFKKFNSDWALVTAGTKDKFNSMTISWGSMGTLWNKRVITIYIRPERYTHHFIEENEYFTISFFDDKYKKELEMMGSLSGRDIDKVKEVGFAPLYIKDDVISYKEANHTYICKKIYTHHMNKDDMPSFALKHYGENGLAHTLFIGEVIDIIK